MSHPNQDLEQQAIMVFVLGLLGMVTCQLLGPIAWFLGNQYLTRCEAEGLTPNGLGVAGRILGIVATAFLVLMALGVLVYFGFAFLYIFLMIFLVAAGAAV